MPPRRIVDQLAEGQDPEELERDAAPEDETPDPVEDDSDEEKDDPDTSSDNEDDDDETPIGDEDEQPPARQARAPSRRERDVAATRRRAQDAERRARDLELENARLRGNGREIDGRESEAVRNARLAAMEPNERIEFIVNEEREERRRERAHDNFRHQDERDRTSYDAIARTNPSYKKYAGEVEHRLQLLRTAGQNAPRETILKFIIGERVIAGRGSPKVKAQRAEAERRVERERTSLPSGRGDNRSRGGSKSADLEKRLANVLI